VAISFSRPDPSSPAAVADANFPTARRGFDQHEVREFLRMVGAELARAHERERFLEQELRTRRQQQAAPALPAELDDETVARLLGEETTRIVQAARESAAAIRSRAEETAERLVRDARDEAQRLREDADLEATRRRKDAETDAEAELEMAKQQGREMVEEARAYRERALAELSRRRDLARQQIDQLIHGRDRLVQAFERARLAAADVVAELAPLGELDEYVNLAPTTGPVPVMVPAAKLAERSSIADDALTVGRRPVPAAPEPAPELDRAPAAVDPAVDEPDEVVEVVDEIVEEVGDDVEVEPVVDEHDDTVELATPDVSTIEASTIEAATIETDTIETDTVEVGRNATVLPFRRLAAPPAVDEPEAEASDADVDVEAGDEIDDDEVTASDVDDLFARLRAQRVTEPTAPSELSGEGAETIEVADAPTAFERRDELLTPLIVACARKLKRVLADEQNTALERLRQKDPVTAVDQLVGAADEHAARYVDAVAGDLLAAARGGADSVNGSCDDDSLRAGDALGTVGDALAAALIAPLRDRLAERVEASGGDHEQITKSARAVYREWKTKHIDDSLDHLLRMAYNRGAYASLPEGTLCRWAADPAVGACSECEDNTLQGVVPRGMAYPTGHVTAPAHDGCRCLLEPADQ